MNELIQLQSSLAQIFRDGLRNPGSWENPQAVKDIKDLNGTLNGVPSAPSSDSIETIVLKYRRTQSVASFRELKYVCYGAAMKMQDGWCLLGNERWRDKLFADVDQLDEPRRRFKCFQALLSSYFAFAPHDEQPTDRAGWIKLRSRLAIHRYQFERNVTNWKLRLPEWFGVLSKHSNLLTEAPCDRYGSDLLRGDSARIEEVRKGLSIPSNSWVMEEAILAPMKSAAAWSDDTFKTHLDPLLRLALGHTEMKVSDLLKRRAIALLISRYARCEGKQEHPALRDTAVSIIGNPWLKKKQWDAWVKKNDGQPDDEARDLVNSWLKQRLIKDFFDVLSEDGRADQRRLNYWLRFETEIEDLWLALGPDATSDRSKPFQDLRERAVGRLLRLENPGQSNNNAFIMRMGDWLIVEFGITGNACYVYPLTPAPFALHGKTVSLYKLKNKNLGEAHNHIAKGWESNFDRAICSKIGYKPGKDMPRPRLQVEQPRGGYAASSNSPDANSKGLNETEFWRQVRQYSLPTDDKRDKGGALWVNIEQSRYPTIDQWLESLGFKYRPGRGWWRE
ncbi:MAG: EH signature domain-containing protein [Pseudomonadota bacterium]